MQTKKMICVISPSITHTFLNDMFLNGKLNGISHIDLQNYLVMMNFEYTLHAIDDQVALIFSGRLQP
jgi:hypothetical protein